MAPWLTLILLWCAIPLGAQEITLSWLTQKPKSYAKDFYIWCFFDQNISAKEADAAFYQIKNVNWKLIHRYAAKTQMPGFAMADRCHRLKATQLPAKSPECSAIAITPYRFTQMSEPKRFMLMQQLSSYPKLLKWMDVMTSQDPFLELVKSDEETFFTIFNRCGSHWRAKYLDRPLPPRLLQRLLKDKRFRQTIKLIVTNPSLKALQFSLLGIDADALNHQSTFFLALNALKLGHPLLAKSYLATAYSKAWFRFDRDKVLFWFYLIDRDRSFLHQLTKSFDLNIYTLYAHEQLHTKWPQVILPHPQLSQCQKNLEDPFIWLSLLKEIKKSTPAKLQKRAHDFSCPDGLGYYAFMMERVQRYKTHYFPIPYQKAFDKVTIEEKAFLLALARQESRFIPASISPSFALGTMQIMPFLVKALARERQEPLDLDSMFDPYKNIAYAIDHLHYLQKHLRHPLFLAYAYNGGIGFTRRMLKKEGMFQKGAYEPWLSMELVHYDESRRYGKKVLANYIVYRQLLGDPIGVSQAVESAIRPSRRDRPQTP